MVSRPGWNYIYYHAVCRNRSLVVDPYGKILDISDLRPIIVIIKATKVVHGYGTLKHRSFNPGKKMPLGTRTWFQLNRIHLKKSGRKPTLIIFKKIIDWLTQGVCKVLPLLKTAIVRI